MYRALQVAQLAWLSVTLARVAIFTMPCSLLCAMPTCPYDSSSRSLFAVMCNTHHLPARFLNIDARPLAYRFASTTRWRARSSPADTTAVAVFAPTGSPIAPCAAPASPKLSRLSLYDVYRSRVGRCLPLSSHLYMPVWVVLFFAGVRWVVAD